MDYLTLVRNALSDSGAQDEGEILTTLAPPPEEPALTPYQSLAARTVAEAWRMIQTDRSAWPFMREEFAALLPEGVTDLTAAMLVQDGPPVWSWWASGGWFLSEAATETGTELQSGGLPQITYEDFRRLYTGAVTPPSRPTVWCETPQRQIRIWPGVGAGRRVTLHGEYIRAPQTLVNDADVPMGLFEAYHDVIKWRAVMILLGGDEADKKYQFAKIAYNDLVSNMEISEGTGDWGAFETLA